MKPFTLLFALFCVANATATSIRVASYNILYDVVTDPHDWAGRKDHVLHTINDANADILGLNEVTLDPQYDDLEEMLPGFGFAGWRGEDTDRAHNDIFANVIAYRKDKIELIEQGYYYLSRDPSKIEFSWDMPHMNSIRHTSWARLRMKDSGEVFTVMSTHYTISSSGPSLARALSAVLNVDKSWEIGGKDPVIMMGDHNANPKHKNVYLLLHSNFDDAYDYRDPNDTATERTSGQWSESGGSRIDFIFSRGFDVSGYTKIDTPYYNGKTPSDHALIAANLTFATPAKETGRIYVSEGGNVGGDGSMQNPFGSIHDAVAAAQRGDSIFITTGRFETDKAISVKKSLRFFGGYDPAFESVCGKTVVTTAGMARGFDMSANTDCELRNITIENCGLPGDANNGGGIRSQGARLILTDCVLKDNEATGSGGGVFMKAGELKVTGTLFLNNRAAKNGGGIATGKPNSNLWFNYTLNKCLFDGNAANEGAAVYVNGYMWCTIGNSTFAHNLAGDGSAVFLNGLYTKTLNAHTSVFNSTLVDNVCQGATAQSSALYVVTEDDAPIALTNCTVMCNNATAAQPAVKLVGGIHYVVHNVIALNGGCDISAQARGIKTANYNIFTTTESVDYYTTARDFTWDSYEAAGMALADAFDVAIDANAPEYERFSAMLTYADDLDDTPYDPERFDGVPPVVKVKNAICNGRPINCLLPSRFSEQVLQGDCNFDFMLDGTLTGDAIGKNRPTDGNATIGAVECDSQAAIQTPHTDGDEGQQMSTRYFDLNGRALQRPGHSGIYIKQENGTARKHVAR